jgi:RES domain-containing protein
MLTRFEGRCWRMLGVRWQLEPLSGEGAAKTGGRWNPPGQKALYLSRDHGTAISEYHQMLVRPGTLVAYDIESEAIADLTKGDFWRDGNGRRFGPSAASCNWRRIWKIEQRTPPTWLIVSALINSGADGALVPSAQSKGGVNLVLWRWSNDPNSKGALVRVIDPESELLTKAQT